MLDVLFRIGVLYMLYFKKFELSSKLIEVAFENLSYPYSNNSSVAVLQL